MSHIHNVIDTDTHYVIDSASREIANAFEIKNILVQHDHNSERLTFEISRYIDKYDLLNCNNNEIIFVNIDKIKKEKNYGSYTIKDLKEKEDDENTLVFTWLVSNEATKYVGSIEFGIRFQCIENDNVDYSWNTATFKIKVIAGMPEDIDSLVEVVELKPEFWYERIEDSWIM